jgi:hypothetical protein
VIAHHRLQDRVGDRSAYVAIGFAALNEAKITESSNIGGTRNSVIAHH